MKTWDDLKQQITPEFIKKLCEYAEGFGYIDYVLSQSSNLEQVRFNNIIFPLLIHRTVEGWNKNNGIGQSGNIFVNDDGLFVNHNDPISYLFKNYQPQSLTQCECAILHCLLEIFKQQEEGDE